jgi:glycosyltransferase involved in cell wall biosynthesis
MIIRAVMTIIVLVIGILCCFIVGQAADAASAAPAASLNRTLAVLIEGWTRVPHSFAIVNCFQIIALVEEFSDMQLYVTETAYYYDFWQPGDYSIFSERQRNILNGVRVWHGDPIDLVYRIHFPLDVRDSSRFRDHSIPMIIFYAATRSVFTRQELIGSNSSSHLWNDKYGDLFDITDASTIVMNLSPSIYFVTPSPGSAHAMRRLMSESQFFNNHRIIPHGVDTDVYYPMKRDVFDRNIIRARYDVGSTDLMFLHVGAMVPSKGLDMMIVAAYWLSLQVGWLGDFKLVLKGLQDVYGSAKLLESKLTSLVADGVFTQKDMQDLIAKHIRFTSQTLPFDDLNELLNAADAYWSPYAYEAFNIPVLEAIATGLPVFVSENGSTTFFVDHICENVYGARERIFLIPAKSYSFQTAMYYGVHPNELFDLVIANIGKIRKPANKYYLHSLTSFLQDQYSWRAVAVQLRRMFEEIVNTHGRGHQQHYIMD